MPRLGGLETLSAIKTDPELYVIPVIMLSSAKSPDEVRDSYQGHANCYVEKPADLEQSVKFIQALEAFWMDFALLPACNEQSLGSRQIIDPNTGTSRIDLPRSGTLPFGPAIACPSAEVSGRGTRIDDSLMNPSETPSESHGCDEHKRLLDAFGTTVRELLSLHEQQFQSIVDGDSECHRFDVLIHMANEQKQMAKYAYLRHVEAHGCSNNDAVKQAGT
jgi:chemotaxis family two-component system response regulator Rcp1